MLPPCSYPPTWLLRQFSNKFRRPGLSSSVKCYGKGNPMLCRSNVHQTTSFAGCANSSGVPTSYRRLSSSSRCLGRMGTYTAVRSPIYHCEDVRNSEYDAVVVVAEKPSDLSGTLECLKEPLDENIKFDAAATEGVSLVKSSVIPSTRLIFSATGSLGDDGDDVRRYYDAASAGIERAIKAGCSKPLLVTAAKSPVYPQYQLAAITGALKASYTPLEVRLAKPEKEKLKGLGVFNTESGGTSSEVEWAKHLESGLALARDIGGSDPETMTAAEIAECVVHEFSHSNSQVKVSVESDVEMFQKEYPLLAAVNRAANGVERHAGRVVFLDYCGDGPITETLCLVGKGVTYDTGGADLKTGGNMAGMHRDKCGAAAVAGFFKYLNAVRPKHLKVMGVLGLVRNSLGTDSYVPDEILTSRANVRVRVNNTDAEGRLVMADLLCLMKERALQEVNPTLFTIATLTGHAVVSAGPDYSVAMGNGPATQAGDPGKLQSAGEAIGDPMEVSILRREDFSAIAGPSEYEDLLQVSKAAAGRGYRGHQYAMAFLVKAAGLDKHSLKSDSPLKYIHMDIAGSAGPFPGIPTGAPIRALANRYVIQNDTKES